MLQAVIVWRVETNFNSYERHFTFNSVNKATKVYYTLVGKYGKDNADKAKIEFLDTFQWRENEVITSVDITLAKEGPAPCLQKSTRPV